MFFRRETARVLPDGELANVAPYHVCTEGQEDCVIFRDEEDLRVAFNMIPICACRANVIILAAIVLNSHIHSALLAKTEDDARRFINGFKISVSKVLSAKYGAGEPLHLFRRIDSRPIPLLDRWHIRNALCYVYKNALDVGEKVDQYRWSSYRTMFSKRCYQEDVKPVSELKCREIRALFKIDRMPPGTNWMMTPDCVIEPASYCDLDYAEGAFDNDLGFFMKIMGLVDCQQMEQELAVNPNRMRTVGELINTMEDLSRSIYGKPLRSLTYSQKIPVIKKVWHTNRTSVAQLARCIGLTKKEILFALGKKEE